jgi:putative phosphonate metabolism protein
VSFPEAGRVAVYYAPPPQDPLFQLSASWLGRDPESGAPIPQPDIWGLDEVTAEPRLYGFHATLKPPMRLRSGASWDALMLAAVDLAAGIAPFGLPPMAVADVHGFLALRETAPSPDLQALADICVAWLDEFRAPPTEDEMARRRRAGLSPVQDAMLCRWGYPYVFGTWFFHMTLTRRLRAPEKARYQPAAERHLAPALAEPRRVSDICLFTQAAPGHPFLLAARLPLRG